MRKKNQQTQRQGSGVHLIRRVRRIKKSKDSFKDYVTVSRKQIYIL